jgi:hypothetical protein
MIYVQTVIPLRSARWFSSPSQQSFDVCEAHATHVNGVLNIDVLLQHDRRIVRRLNNISLVGKLITFLALHQQKNNSRIPGG